MHYKLFFSDPSESVITVKPSTGTLKPQESCQINLNIRIRALGEQTFDIGYKVREDRSSEIIVDSEELENLLSVEYVCLYPTLKVTNLFEVLVLIVPSLILIVRLSI